MIRKLTLSVFVTVLALCHAAAQTDDTAYSDMLPVRNGRSLLPRDARFFVGADFDTFFDNREYKEMGGFSPSCTYFSATLVLYGGLQWNERNSITAGIDLTQDFGDGAEFISDCKPVFFYSFRSQRVLASAGLIPNAQLLGRFSELFFDNAEWFYDNRIAGVLTHYRGKSGFVEFSIDWKGMQSPDIRERFRILTDGEWRKGCFYGGYAFSMLHMANSSDSEVPEGVVENLTANPYVGLRGGRRWHFDLRAGLVQSIQRERKADKTYRPTGGEVAVSVERWGLSLANHLYFGGTQMPMYAQYGSLLYSGSPFFSTTEKFYNRTALEFNRRFFNDTVGVRAGIVFHYDGVGLGTQQLLQVDVRLQKRFEKRR